MTDDQSRHVVTSPDSDFKLTIDQALDRYASAGLPRTPRSVQRYCAKGHLQCRFIETEFGAKYLISPESVEKHIAYIKEVTPATSRGMSRHVAADAAPENSVNSEPRQAASSRDLSRPVGAVVPDTSRYVAQLEKENEFLRDQVGVKDKQIAELSELYRGTHVLTLGLQRLLAPGIGAPDPLTRPGPDNAIPEQGRGQP